MAWITQPKGIQWIPMTRGASAPFAIQAGIDQGKVMSHGLHCNKLYIAVLNKY